ncbi:MAG: hypothetical protein DRN15_05055 [Thermoprotei archaeon]|nr:MAG: hypothetical protein DRM97_06950 [Thermoprotei archaeon]RLF23813.1 MAG: hypothetical protein DRN15_05055 [Thermoprotei archaeon]
MKPRERALKAIYLEEPDVVPVFDYDINSPVASKILGREAFIGIGAKFMIKYIKMLSEGKRDKLVKRMIEDRIDVYTKLKLDIIPVRLVPSKEYVPKVEWLGPYNWRVYIGEYDGKEIWFEYKACPESDIVGEYDSSIAREGLEGFETYVRFLESQEVEVDPTTLELVEYAVKKIGSEYLIMGDIDGTFPVGWSWIHVFLKALYQRPDLVRRYISRSTRYAVEHLKAMIDIGVEAASGGCDYAGKNGPFMSPRHFKEFILPALKEQVNVCHRRGVPYIKHTDGNIKPIEREFIVESGIDGYLAIEPIAGMDIGKLKREYGDRICLLGNVDCAYTLVFGTPEEVAKETREVIAKAADGGGLVVASSNSIHSGVKLENFLTMIRTARKYGRYPRIGRISSQRAP